MKLYDANDKIIRRCNIKIVKSQPPFMKSLQRFEYTVRKCLKVYVNCWAKELKFIKCSKKQLNWGGEMPELIGICTWVVFSLNILQKIVSKVDGTNKIFETARIFICTTINKQRQRFPVIVNLQRHIFTERDKSFLV